MAPPREAKLPEQREAGQVVPENEPEQRLHADRRGVRDRVLQELRTEPAAAEALCDVHADFHRAAVRRTTVERREAEPRRNGAVALDHPERPGLRPMLFEPVLTTLDADGREIGRDHARGYRRVV